MILNDLSPWNAGYGVGHKRGLEDGLAETLNRYTRDPDHRGHHSEPPNLPATDRAAWVDGFMEGYRHGRDDAMNGGGHVES